jgi:DNA polymerase III epsilon subunit-like protein
MKCLSRSEKLSSVVDSQRHYSWSPFSGSLKWRKREKVNRRKWATFIPAVRRINCVFVDLETGGLDNDSPVCQIAAFSLNSGLVYGKLEFGVIPFDESRMTEAAKRINGWKEVKDTDITENEALFLIKSMFDLHPSRTRVPLAGHFVSADFKWMASMAERCGREDWPPEGMSRKLMDTCTLATPMAFLDGLKSTSLDKTCEHLGIYDELMRGEMGHKSPLYDCYASAAVMFELMWRYA